MIDRLIDWTTTLVLVNFFVTARPVDQSIDWLIDWLISFWFSIDWLIDWLMDYETTRFDCWLTESIDWLIDWSWTVRRVYFQVTSSDTG